MSGPVISSIQPLTSAQHPISNAVYRRWLLGSAVSVFGDQFYLVALPWLVLHVLGSAGMLGAVLLVGALPRAVLTLVGGAVTDRVSARRIMLVAAAVRATCVAAVGGLVGLDMLSAWEVYALVFAFGVADAFAIPAQTAYMPALLGKEQLAAGLSLGQGAQLVAYTIGPIPAGFAVARFGTGPAFIIDAVGFLVVMGTLLGLPDPPIAPAQTNPIGDIRDGLTHVFRDVPLRRMMLLVAVTNLCGLGAITVGLAYLVNSRFGSSTAYGVVLSAGAVGTLVGTLAGGAWKIRQRGLLILACQALMGLCLMGLPLVSSVWGVASVQVLMGAAAGISTLCVMAWIMQRVDVALRGRVSSLLMLSSLGMAPMSMALSGFLATWGVTVLFVLPGACLVTVAAGAGLLRSWREVR